MSDEFRAAVALITSNSNNKWFHRFSSPRIHSKPKKYIGNRISTAVNRCEIFVISLYYNPGIVNMSKTERSGTRPYEMGN